MAMDREWTDFENAACFQLHRWLPGQLSMLASAKAMTSTLSGLIPELPKAKQPLIHRFYGTVLRCEQGREGDFSFGIALQGFECRYLPKEEAARLAARFANLGLGGEVSGESKALSAVLSNPRPHNRKKRDSMIFTALMIIHQYRKRDVGQLITPSRVKGFVRLARCAAS
jgi:hypothetical protein